MFTFQYVLLVMIILILLPVLFTALGARSGAVL
jgi:hypothetical protein